MDTADPLGILNSGVAAWNAARRDATSPDWPWQLPGVDLSQRALRGADFSGVNLRGASLRGCDLEGADLSFAWLEGADMTGARLVLARLDGAHLTRCRLDDAVFVDDAATLGDAQQLRVLLTGAEAWDTWRCENPDVEIDLPAYPVDAACAKRVRTQAALAQALESTTFEGDPGQLQLLRSGVEAWNAWRQAHPDIRPNLRGAHLVDAELAGVNFESTDLRGAFLVRANLQGAILSGADLCEAWLCQADLSGVAAVAAAALDADLSGADLRGAHLFGADFHGANLTGAWLDATTQQGSGALDKADFFEGDAQQLALLYGQGRDDGWNAWRARKPQAVPDLRGAKLVDFDARDADLSGANLARAHLRRLRGFQARLAGADLSWAQLTEAGLRSADLRGAALDLAVLTEAELGSADLRGASLRSAKLDHADLRSADLSQAVLPRALLANADLGAANLSGAKLNEALLLGADLTRARLSGADLTNACLVRAMMVETVVDGALFTGAWVYGISAWGLDLSAVADQTNLAISPVGPAGPSAAEDSGLTVDNLELAQFVYLMLHNEKIRGVIDTIGRKAVLILGRFTAERKAVLDALKDRLRRLDLVPIVCDWTKPSRRDLTETISLLANLSRFVVADLTAAKSIPQELSEIVPHLPSVPVQPILLRGDPGYALFEHWRTYRTMLPVFEYHDLPHLLDNVRSAILDPVDAWEAGADPKAALQAELQAKDDEIARLRALLQQGGRGAAA